MWCVAVEVFVCLTWRNVREKKRGKRRRERERERDNFEGKKSDYGSGNDTFYFSVRGR